MILLIIFIILNLKIKIVKFTDISNKIIEINFQLYFYYNKKTIIIAFLIIIKVEQKIYFYNFSFDNDKFYDFKT